VDMAIDEPGHEGAAAKVNDVGVRCLKRWPGHFCDLVSSHKYRAIRDKRTQFKIEDRRVPKKQTGRLQHFDRVSRAIAA
jgi:hypothetical protein